MDEVKSANVLLTANNAFIAVVLPPGTTTSSDMNAKNPTDRIHQAAAGADLSLQLKQLIAEKVKAVNPNIRNVYISANPDFVQRINGFSQDVKNGRPVSGFMNEFNTIVQRIFPSNAGSRIPTGPSK
jgi:YhcN/YlaJ family sporulation lipoprotein